MQIRLRILVGCCFASALVTSVQAASWRYRSNSPPVISGTPSTTVAAGSAYSFTPTASDSDGNRLRFYIRNMPGWATFSSSTGKLSGTPSTTQAGTYSNISIRVSDGRASTYLPAFTLMVTAADASQTINHAPVISGSPATSIEAGGAYSFQPTANDVDGDTLLFSVSGKPAWATFSLSTGLLTGSPSVAQVGSYNNISISVNDGAVSKSLASFNITVTAPVAAPAPNGAATLNWAAPTQNTDGSLLTNLGGYRIYHGTSDGALTDVRVVAANLSSYQFSSLTPGVHYFAISAYNTDGVESVLSPVGTKNIP